jgi:hypothetical protein
MKQQDAALDISSAPSPAYAKFFAKFSEIDSLPVNEWKINHLLAFFCKLYKTHYTIDYTFRLDNKAPSKSYEVFQMNRLAKMLSKQPSILKDYIEWFFADKLIAKKKRITSLALMTEIGIVNEYKFKFLLNTSKSSIDRTSKLPVNILSIVEKFDDSIKTYGELAFAKLYADSNPTDAKYAEVFSQLAASGFDLKILERIK